MSAHALTEIERNQLSLYPNFSENYNYLPIAHYTNKQQLPNYGKSVTEILDTGIGELFDYPEETTVGDAENTKIHQLSQSSKPVESDIVNRDRLVLLAKKYANKDFSKEDDARLEILAEKIRLMIPRVTMDDFERLHDIVGEINKINQEDMELRKELGM